MSLKARVIQAVNDAQVSTFDDLQQSFPEVPREALQKVLWMAAFEGGIETVRMIGRESLYYVPNGQTVRFSSVWDYGQRA